MKLRKKYLIAILNLIDIFHSIWRIYAKNYPSLRPKAEVTYGVKQMNTLVLTELALNMKEPKIHKLLKI